MDDIDRAQVYTEAETEQAIRAAAKDLKPGKPGDCDLCQRWSGRLIDGACAPCRERYGLE